ncbi:unnamed protein product [Boreogadus saida]
MSSINCLSHNDSDPAQKSPAGLSTALASVLILTIVVDIVGNVLVILSVFRNKKLRNAVAGLLPKATFPKRQSSVFIHKPLASLHPAHPPSLVCTPFNPELPYQELQCERP